MSKISFCITCKGRLYQFSQTILKNIKDNLDHPDNEFTLINHNSPDDLDNWVKTNLQEHINSGKFIYCRLLDTRPWHVCHAKNIAHRIATGDVLCNLDGDNFTGRGFARFIEAEMAKNRNMIGWVHSTPSTCGRIFLTAELFAKLGGYDETFKPMAYQDLDLVERGKGLGARVTRYAARCEFMKTIPNGMSKIKYCSGKDSYATMQDYNHFLSIKNINKGIYHANLNGYGKGSLLKNFTETIMLE